MRPKHPLVVHHVGRKDQSCRRGNTSAALTLPPSQEPRPREPGQAIELRAALREPDSLWAPVSQQRRPPPAAAAAAAVRTSGVRSSCRIRPHGPCQHQPRAACPAAQLDGNGLVVRRGIIRRPPFRLVVLVAIVIIGAFSSLMMEVFGGVRKPMEGRSVAPM